MRRWPDSLPGPSVPYMLTPADNTIRTDMEVGSRRVRRVSRARRDFVDVTWVFNRTQFELFRAWWGDEDRSLAGDSDDLTDWTLVRASIVADAVLGPDDALADRIVEDTATGEHRAERRFLTGVTAGGTMALTASLKAAGRNARFGLRTLANTVDWAEIDLTTGAIVATSGSVVVATLDRGLGWWRLTFEAAVLTGATTPALIVWAKNPAGVNYTGDGVSGVEVCEVQARMRSGFDLFGRTGADGRVTGAAEGAAWALIPLSVGGSLAVVEARFDGPFQSEALPGLGWRVTARLEVRNA